MYLITGACGGLGKAFCFACADRGIDLFITDIDEKKLKKLKTCLDKLYDIRVEAYICDLSDQDDRDRFYEHLQTTRNPFSGLINIAGGDVEGDFRSRDLREMRANMNLNMLSIAENMRVVLSLREDEKEPFLIINVASLAAFQPMPYKALYAASKHFILQLSLALREEFDGDNISITTLCPAGMPTSEDSIIGIRTQGFMGRVTTRNVGDVAEITLKRALRNKAITVPGCINRFIKSMSSAIPSVWSARIVKKRWKASADQMEVKI